MNQRVEPTVQVDGPSDGVPPRGLVGDVEVEILRLSAGRSYRGGGLLAEVVVHVGEDDARTLAGEQDGGGSAEALQTSFDARGGSGYEGYFAIDPHADVSLTRR